ncbi:uncharacterized protein LOC143560998 [Bidens hawaiensis]|uniref:uncharacterized protein LOC143560998 n=1 Tax=Bidens hawaiensis TaxID=980011 RepID=UPI0040497653
MRKREVNGDYEERKRFIMDLEAVPEQRPLSQQELEMRAECLAVVEAVDLEKQKDLHQKARVRWAMDGDDNTSYFHGILNANLSSNKMHGLMVHGAWVLDPVVVKREVFNHFATRFLEPLLKRPEIVCAWIGSLNDAEANGLVVPFSLSEIKNAVWDCEGDRLPGPDGYNFRFIKRCWNCFQGDL